MTVSAGYQYRSPSYVPFLTSFLVGRVPEPSLTKIDYTKKGTLVLTSLQEDLVKVRNWLVPFSVLEKCV